MKVFLLSESPAPQAFVVRERPALQRAGRALTGRPHQAGILGGDGSGQLSPTKPEMRLWSAHVRSTQAKVLQSEIPSGRRVTRVAGVEGLEPPTPGFGDRCSSQLSYTPAEEATLPTLDSQAASCQPAIAIPTSCQSISAARYCNRTPRFLLRADWATSAFTERNAATSIRG